MKVQAGVEYKDSLGVVWFVTKVFKNGRFLARPEGRTVECSLLPSKIKQWAKIN